jgi:hypothetical protein
VVLGVLAALAQGGAGVVVWDWVGDYLQYRRLVVAITHPGQKPTHSLEEFLRYRQAIAFYDAAEHLRDVNATAQEVRDALGEPRDVLKRPERNSWFYSGVVFQGHRQPTIIVIFDPKTYRVQDIGYIRH